MSKQYDAAAQELILRTGHPATQVQPTGSDWLYGWVDHEADEHFHGPEACKWEAGMETELVEYSYSEFGDTFGGNNDVHVMALTHAHCVCGRYKDCTVGRQATVSALLAELLGPTPLTVRREYL